MRRAVTTGGALSEAAPDADIRDHPDAYNIGMPETLLDGMKRYVGFTDEDAANLRSLGADARPIIPVVVDRFYDELLRHEGARAVLNEGEAQIATLRHSLTAWMERLFAGDYGGDYFEARRRIGSAHVRVGLPQHYMFTGMEVIWRELETRIRSLGVPDGEQKLRSLHKLLMLDLAVMLESYKDRYSEQVRAVERSVVEEKLTRAEHLAEIGQLAASLAHEIKNPLAGISGAIQIIRDDLHPEDPHQPVIGEILAQISRLDATVKDLLTYARPTPIRASRVALHQVVGRVLTVLREEPALQGRRIEFEAPPTDTIVLADDAQLEQLLFNLLINAAHASGDNGLIRLSITRNSREMKLRVKDYGEGMPPGVRERAFEPFYTTKARGTGLGLSICRRIAEAHGGHIELHSEPGRGTLVTVTLPFPQPGETEPRPKQSGEHNDQGEANRS